MPDRQFRSQGTGQEYLRSGTITHAGSRKHQSIAGSDWQCRKPDGFGKFKLDIGYAEGRGGVVVQIERHSDITPISCADKSHRGRIGTSEVVIGPVIFEGRPEPKLLVPAAMITLRRQGNVPVHLLHINVCFLLHMPTQLLAEIAVFDRFLADHFQG